MDKGLSIVRRISTKSEQPNTFTNASIFPDKKTAPTWRNELIFDYFLTAIEGKEQKLPNSCVHNASDKACYSWVFLKEQNLRQFGLLGSYVVSKGIGLPYWFSSKQNLKYYQYLCCQSRAEFQIVRAARLLLCQQRYQVTKSSRPALFKQRQNYGSELLTDSYLQLYFPDQINMFPCLEWYVLLQCRLATAMTRLFAKFTRPAQH